MTTPHRTLREAAQMALDALLIGYHRGTHDAITALREALAAPEPEPVALESVHLTRDTRGMCVVRVNGRVAIRDNGDIIDHMATLEWFAAPPAAPAPAAPVVREPLPLTKERLQRHALFAADAPPSSAVVLLSSLHRLLGITGGGNG